MVSMVTGVGGVGLVCCLLPCACTDLYCHGDSSSVRQGAWVRAGVSRYHSQDDGMVLRLVVYRLAGDDPSNAVDRELVLQVGKAGVWTGR